MVCNGRMLEIGRSGGVPLVLGTEEASARREQKKKCHKGTGRIVITSHLNVQVMNGWWCETSWQGVAWSCSIWIRAVWGTELYFIHVF